MYEHYGPDEIDEEREIIDALRRTLRETARAGTVYQYEATKSLYKLHVRRLDAMTYARLKAWSA